MTSQSDLPEDLLDLERQRFAAMLAADVPRLRELLSERLQYVHSSGSADSYLEYLSGVETGLFHYKGLTPSRQTVTMLDGVAIIDGDLLLDAVAGGVILNFDCRTLSLWAIEEGRWRLIRFHSTNIKKTSSEPADG